MKQKTNSESTAEAQVDESYKSDALDELLEGSLFKKKESKTPMDTDQMVNAAMYAKVDPKTLGIDDSSSNQQAAQAPAVVAPPPDNTQV